MPNPQAEDNKRRIKFCLRVRTSVGPIRLRCVRETIDDDRVFLRLEFNWDFAFEKDLALFSMQPLAGSERRPGLLSTS